MSSQLQKNLPSPDNPLIIFAAVVVILAGIKTAAAMIVPFLLAIFLSIIFHPAVTWMTRHRIPRTVAVMVVVCIMLLGMFLLAGVVGGSLNELSRSIPVYREQLSSQMRWIAEFLQTYDIDISVDFLLTYFDPSMVFSMATNTLSSLSGVMANLFLILLTVVFMLLEGHTMGVKLHHMFDDPGMKLDRLDRFLESVNRYMAIKAVISAFTGMLVSTMLWSLGVDFYLLWGILAFLLNFIPNIGSIIAAIPAVLLTMLQLGPGTALGVAAGYVTINILIGNVIEPRYMGKGLGLSTLIVFMSLIFWGWLLGTTGMLLAVPLTMVVKIGLESSSDMRWLTMILSDGRQLPAGEEEETDKAA